MRDEVIGLRRSWPDLDVGVGVSSGVAVAGNVGAEERYEYTVVGDPVNEAARLTEAAKTVSERVMASAATVEAAGPEGSCWRSVGSLPLRGRAIPTEAFVPVVRAYGQDVSVGPATTSS
jgi:adenylate cyclase